MENRDHNLHETATEEQNKGLMGRLAEKIGLGGKHEEELSPVEKAARDQPTNNEVTDKAMGHEVANRLADTLSGVSEKAQDVADRAHERAQTHRDEDEHKTTLGDMVAKGTQKAADGVGHNAASAATAFQERANEIDDEFKPKQTSFMERTMAAAHAITDRIGFGGQDDDDRSAIEKAADKQPTNNAVTDMAHGHEAADRLANTLSGVSEKAQDVADKNAARTDGEDQKTTLGGVLAKGTERTADGVAHKAAEAATSLQGRASEIDHQQKPAPSSGPSIAEQAKGATQVLSEKIGLGGQADDRTALEKAADKQPTNNEVTDKAHGHEAADRAAGAFTGISETAQHMASITREQGSDKEDTQRKATLGDVLADTTGKTAEGVAHKAAGAATTLQGRATEIKESEDKKN